MKRSHRIKLVGCITLVLLLSGCAPISSVTIGRHGHRGHTEVTHDHHHQGPPPHAQAHGRRRHQKQHQQHHDHMHVQAPRHEVEMVFDSDLGIYIVVDIPNRYYWDGHYLRLDGDDWYASARLDGRWERCDERSLPPGAHKAKKKHRRPDHAKARGKAKGRKDSPPAKGRWDHD